MSGGNGDLGREAHIKRKPGLIAMFGHMEMTLHFCQKLGMYCQFHGKHQSVVNFKENKKDTVFMEHCILYLWTMSMILTK